MRFVNSVGLNLCLIFAPFGALANEPASPAPKPTEELRFEPGAESWVRVERMFTPAYPRALLADKVTGEVKVELLIDATGAARQIREISSTPANAEFETAVRNVLKYWKFKPPVTRSCEAIESVGQMVISFEISDDKPKVLVSHRRAPEPPSTLPRYGSMLNGREVGEVLQMGFPVDARRRGIEAVVGVVFKVDQNTGEVVEAEPAFSTLDWAIEEKVRRDYFAEIVGPNEKASTVQLARDAGLERKFRSAATEGIKIARFTPEPERAGPWRGCRTVRFVLRGESLR